MPDKLKTLYQSDYFKDRLSNNNKRLRSFNQELNFIQKHVTLEGTCLDVGCSTGEFLTQIGWEGKKIGIEISETAAKYASLSGVKIVEKHDNENSLDVVFYRGTIQHLDSPFKSIQRAAKTLKPGGVLFFIATPNVDSLYFRLFGDLPALDPERNFYLPGRKSLVNICNLFDLNLIDVEYPYLRSPYSRPIVDHAMFICRLFAGFSPKLSSNIRFPFWKNMMNIAFKKK